MNLHVPQSIDAEVELMTISRCALHIVTAQRNGPVNGPVQDALIASFLLTNTWTDGTLTTLDSDLALTIYKDAQIPDTRVKDLLHRAKKYYPECIIADVGESTDQSTYRENNCKKNIDKNVNRSFEDGETTESNLEFSACFEKLKFTKEIPGSLFLSVVFPPNFCYERTIDPPIVRHKPIVEIKDGIILPSSGPLEARTVGGKNGSVAHDLWKCSPELALYFISDLQQITDRWLPTHGFTIGPRDCLANNSEDVAKVLLETRAKVDSILDKNINSGHKLEIDIGVAVADAMAVGPRLAKNSMVGQDRNALNVMRNAGAKGSVINLTQITGFVGQQNIRGQRMPLHLSHGSRCLPCFLPGDNSLGARGFIENNYFKGLTPSEAFFHAAAGRDGVISTSMRTADTGYTQKRIAQKIKDLKVWIDGSVRDANGRIVSFMYGDDGFDPKKLVTVKGLSSPFFVNPYTLARQLNSDARRSSDMSGERLENPRKLSNHEIDLLLQFIIFSKIDSPVIEKITENAHMLLRKLVANVDIYETKIPDFFAGLRDAYNGSKAAYGMMVGLIATSSLGEPTTQMALSMFHNTGVKEKDVSSGVPRFKEMINTTKSKDQKKAGCTIYFHNEIVKNNAIKIKALDSSKEVENTKNGENKQEKITQLKKESLLQLQSLKNDFEYTKISDFLIDSELKYLPKKNQDIKKIFSPTGLLTYEEYEEEWWITLAKNIGKLDSKIKPDSWVIILHFDVEKLYRRRIELEDIALVIENHNSDFTCIVSPNITGRIEIYANLEELREYLKSKVNGNFTIECEHMDNISSVEGTEHENRKFLLSESNIDYFICRDVIIDNIKKIQVTGISGINKVYPRENIKTHEYVMDTDGINFLDVLTMPNVDTTRTVCDDMHSINAMLGIEAAQKIIFDELSRVISFDGTYVNPRHIQILVDSMTVNGTLTAASRDGISRDVGPNAKIMFEKNIDNAVIASAFTERDNMKSLASSVMYGKMAYGGSGMVVVRNKNKLPIRK